VHWPGRAYDAKVLANSDIYRLAEDRGGYLFPRGITTLVTELTTVRDALFLCETVKLITCYHSIEIKGCEWSIGSSPPYWRPCIPPEDVAGER
jgi:hypothetical protein